MPSTAELPAKTPSQGPKPHWYIYVAAVICASFFSRLADDAVFFLGSLMLEERTPSWLVVSTLAGVSAGLVWGIIFRWAERLRLIIVAPLVFVAMSAFWGPVVIDFFQPGSATESWTELRDFLVLSIGLNLAAFWAVFLGLAVPPRMQR